MKKITDTALPPMEVARVAAQALEMRLRFKRGGTLESIAIARDLRDRKPIGVVKLRTIARFFQTAEKGTEAWEPNQEGYPSAARIGWDLYGGDATIHWLEELQFRPRRLPKKRKPESQDP